MAAIKVELSQLREVVVSLQTNVQSLNATSPSSGTSAVGVGRPVPRRHLLPTPAPNPWISRNPPGQQQLHSNYNNPWVSSGPPHGPRTSYSAPRPSSGHKGVKQTKTPSPPPLMSGQTYSRPVTSHLGNTHGQPTLRQHHQSRHQPGGSLGGVRLPVSAAAAAAAAAAAVRAQRKSSGCPPSCTRSCCHQGLPPSGQPPPLTHANLQRQSAGATEANIPVKNRFDVLSDHLNM